MARTWENFECEFFTGNTENARGDSKYLVLKEGMTRTALINFKRAPKQVLTGNPCIAYLKPNSGLLQAIMLETDDSKITIVSVSGDSIVVKVSRGPMEPFVGEASRVPANGLATFDFVNENGVLSHIHVGHEVKLLQTGRPRRHTV